MSHPSDANKPSPPPQTTQPSIIAPAGKMPPSVLTTHASRCSKRPIKCIRCCQLFPADAIVAHSTNCKFVPVINPAPGGSPSQVQSQATQQPTSRPPIKIPPPPPFPPPSTATTPVPVSQLNTRRASADPRLGFRFQQKQCNGEMLLELTESDLINDFGVRDRVQRERILHAIEAINTSCAFSDEDDEDDEDEDEVDDLEESEQYDAQASIDSSRPQMRHSLGGGTATQSVCWFATDALTNLVCMDSNVWPPTRYSSTQISTLTAKNPGKFIALFQ
ncbi:unnamed protein product [Phytophthora fragariaefolia]|uniref:Unnamed protein product n=1 Tax=Phytophthora fragariaefolia TaxID=1490495 RepID=A0A9W6TVC4_9STRA|nr:unnamed protein product [Phytophthora fragariaefolia]